MFARFESRRGAVYLYAAGSIAAGILDLIWREFEASHQPIQALGDRIPGLAVLAVVAAVWLIAGGVAILLPRVARAGALALTGIYLVFAAFWIPRFYTAVHALGFRFAVVIGLFAGVGQQAILAGGGVVFYGLRAARGMRLVFGLAAIAFGLAHLTGVRQVAAMVPKWLPGREDFWAVLTGVAFVLAGLSVITRVLDEAAARLLAVMLFCFSVLVLPGSVLARPHDHVAWGSNAYNLAAVGAMWIFASALARRDEVKGGAEMKLTTYVNFAGQCAEAFRFYQEQLGAKIVMMVRHGDTPEPTPLSQGELKNTILHAGVSIGETVLAGADIPHAQPMRSAYLTLNTESDSEAERIFAALADGGQVFMPMQETFFASRFGQLRDRFGINWVILHEREMAR